ncbi:hypothetical protein RchiOBHm_Chr7g0231021 [Rosa chinensis]|uniref:Copper transporter n=1 Tax=Rosa chinensis TaxID=74649 RepID=A0A2P6PFK4_ROSCH|nr:hypothetical protein RchiOBHm_Chr7g0231021 [Rosa chinensis]
MVYSLYAPKLKTAFRTRSSSGIDSSTSTISLFNRAYVLLGFQLALEIFNLGLLGMIGFGFYSSLKF